MHLKILICDWDQISLMQLIFHFPIFRLLRTNKFWPWPQQLNLQLEFASSPSLD